MKKIITTLSCVCLALICMSSAPLEARRHCHSCHRSSTSVSVGFGHSYQTASDVYVVRQYAQPAPVVYVQQPQYYVEQPQYYAPVYVAPQPVYVEQVRVVRPSPFIFSGLSFSWNLFR